MSPSPITAPAAPALTLEQTILHDLFLVGVAAASIFVKNPASQEKAATLIGILQQLLPSL